MMNLSPTSPLCIGGWVQVGYPTIPVCRDLSAVQLYLVMSSLITEGPQWEVWPPQLLTDDLDRVLAGVYMTVCHLPQQEMRFITPKQARALIDGCRYLHVYTRLSSVNIRPDHEDATERSHFSLYVRTRSHYLCPASYFALSRYPRIWSLHWTEHNYLTFWISCKQLITIIRSA